MKRLIVVRCPVHNFYAVSIGDESASDRITPSKCCGRWDEVVSWRLSVADWDKLSRLAKEALAGEDA